ncbi:uncharacterized protein LOC132714089 [Ruditapes philippinarum]|uniref:uncharacterized protein LOC132714089 n=1 Tax=Ruditapes philippinarum TaxID=129788 RepID=UPI00295AFDF6|nr:uncharacterized protein LOC132714089 [Ruditapes philippinarum]
MDIKFCLLFVALCALLQKAESIKCYVCNNQLEPKCGATLELKGSEAKKYIEECEGETVACKKLESKDTYKETVLVTRSCFSANDTQIPSDFFTCSKLSQGISCYCKGARTGEPCNGAPATMTYISVTTTLLATILSQFI